MQLLDALLLLQLLLHGRLARVVAVLGRQLARRRVLERAVLLLHRLQLLLELEPHALLPLLGRCLLPVAPPRREACQELRPKQTTGCCAEHAPVPLRRAAPLTPHGPRARHAQLADAVRRERADAVGVPLLGPGGRLDQPPLLLFGRLELLLGQLQLGLELLALLAGERGRRLLARVGLVELVPHLPERLLARALGDAGALEDERLDLVAESDDHLL